MGRSIPVQDLQLPIPDDNRILFYNRDREIFGFLSNYYEAPTDEKVCEKAD